MKWRLGTLPTANLAELVEAEQVQPGALDEGLAKERELALRIQQIPESRVIGFVAPDWLMHTEKRSPETVGTLKEFLASKERIATWNWDDVFGTELSSAEIAKLRPSPLSLGVVWGLVGSGVAISVVAYLIGSYPFWVGVVDWFDEGGLLVTLLGWLVLAPVAVMALLLILSGESEALQIIAIIAAVIIGLCVPASLMMAFAAYGWIITLGLAMLGIGWTLRKVQVTATTNALVNARRAKENAVLLEQMLAQRVPDRL